MLVVETITKNLEHSKFKMPPCENFCKAGSPVKSKRYKGFNQRKTWKRNAKGT